MKQQHSAKLGLAPAIYLVALITSVPASAQGLLTSHRVSSVVATELVAGAVAACKEQGYNATATLVDFDGVRQAMLRGDGAGIATLDTSNDKAYTAIRISYRHWHPCRTRENDAAIPDHS